MTEDPIVPLMHAFVAAIDASQARRGNALPDDWESFAIVLGLDDDGEYQQSYGYAYGAEDAWVKPISAEPASLEKPLADFVADRYPNGQTPPVKILFQLRLTDGSYDTTYEDSDRSRWQVSPNNFEQIQQDLKPVFDD
ncbi:hypothetical protein [Microbacterium sp. MPKO10]|uniref:hypothetical protein n=1 Tax=Microbacterium sp. MPKO10 TaxID=2989818 RepID=UPI00223671A2|nr:hypothetical protein [Microbacterium sp. MPKO10]MCW4457987.1 hypothetical protein [Microbacterium sp. MPKO10]